MTNHLPPVANDQELAPGVASALAWCSGVRAELAWEMRTALHASAALASLMSGLSLNYSSVAGGRSHLRGLARQSDARETRKAKGAARTTSY
jgi:hypothetical protein